MKFLKLKNFLFGVTALLAVAIVMTACEQEAISHLNDDVFIENSALHTGAPHECNGECHVVPDFTEKITIKLPFATKETEVVVGVKDGIAYYEGDIILGKLSDLKEKGVSSDIERWPNSTLPYVIGPGFSAGEITKIQTAAANITANTNLCVVERTTEANFVTFNVSTVCNSFVGMQGGGSQRINLSINCGLGSTIHELLHAAGVWHEQSREDRDDFVTINFDNIMAGRAHNFNRQIFNATDIGNYDYGSLMHYGATAFSRNGLPTITAPPGVTIGQRTGLSAGDIATINNSYPVACNTETNSLTWNPTPTSISNGNNQVTLDYSTDRNSTIYLQVFNSSWSLIGQVIQNVSPGSDRVTLTLPANNPSTTNNFMQAKLYDAATSTMILPVLQERVPLGGTPPPPPPTGGNSLSWNPTPTSISNGNNPVTVDYSIDRDGIIFVQVFNSNWALIGQVYQNVSPGASQLNLILPADNPSTTNNFMQAKLYDAATSTMILPVLQEKVPLGGTPPPPPPTGGNSLSWNPAPTSISNGNNQINLDYSINQSGIVYVEVFDASWKSIGKTFRNVSAGSSQVTLTLNANGVSSSENHIQAKMHDSGWGDIGVPILYKKL